MIIGVTGYKQSGKSTVSRQLVACGFELLPLAKPLKDMLATLGLTHEQLWGDEKEEPVELLGGKTARWAMQTLGTEWGRDLIDPDLWARAWKKRAANHRLVVCDDVRFPNEVELIRSLGGQVWRVTRANNASNDNHPSEQHIGSLVVDAEIHNNGTLRDLAVNASILIRSISRVA